MNNAGQPAAPPPPIVWATGQPAAPVAPAPLHTFGHNFKGPIHFGLFPSHALEKASPQLHVLHAQAH